MPCPREVPRVPGGELRDCSLCPIRSGPCAGGERGRGAPGHRQVSPAWDRRGRGDLASPGGWGGLDAKLRTGTGPELGGTSRASDKVSERVALTVLSSVAVMRM